MFHFHGRADSDYLKRRRRHAIRRIWPALSSERLVRMIQGLILIAATRPEKLKTLELVIALAIKPKPADARLVHEARTRKSG